MMFRLVLQSFQVLAFTFLFVGCASSELRGTFVEPVKAVPEFSQPSLVYVFFADKVVFSPSGLSALRVGVPKFTVGNSEVEAAFRRIATHIDREVPDLSVRSRFQSTQPASPMTGASHVVLLTPRKISSGQGTGTMADVEVLIRDEKSRQVIWKGEVTVTSDSRNSAKVATELLRVLGELGIRPKAL